MLAVSATRQQSSAAFFIRQRRTGNRVWDTLSAAGIATTVLCIHTSSSGVAARFFGNVSMHTGMAPFICGLFAAFLCATKGCKDAKLRPDTGQISRWQRDDLLPKLSVFAVLNEPTAPAAGSSRGGSHFIYARTDRRGFLCHFAQATATTLPRRGRGWNR